VPLLVQESYLTSFGTDRTELADLEKMADAADFISQGDLISTQIRTDQRWTLLPDYGTMSSVAPCLAIQGKLTYPAFPQFLGKNSSLRKVKRLQRELRRVVPCSVGKVGLQLEIVPLALKQILLFLGRGRVDLVLDYLDDMGITNEMVKEHLLCLSMDRKLNEKLEHLDPQLKATLTREYNKCHKDITRVIKNSAKGKEPASGDEASSHDESEPEGQLLDEIQLQEIKKGKQQEKAEKKAQAAMKRLNKL